ncbi:hypothetical protein ABZV78_31140 [Micromonospora sp. NPDC004540]|uniref:hypothetical protein n=1 Tax=Micromonospora sp. NPDC004540 TaxID=3154457 RepID=UPI0033B133EE
MPATYGDQAQPDWTVPAFVLTHPDCPPAVREAFDALDAANDATREANAEADAVADRIADHRADVAAAIRDGKKIPTPITHEIAEEMTRQAETRVRAARNRAVAAAKAVEDVIPEHHETLRPILSARVPELTEATARAFREARQAYREAEALTTAIASLDNVREMRRPVTPEQRQAIAKRSRALHYRHPENQLGRSMRIALAWQDVEAVATGLPADLIAADPYAEEV